MTICGSRICNSRLLGTGNCSLCPGSRLFHISDIGCVAVCRSAAKHVRNRRIIGINAIRSNESLSTYGQAIIINHRAACCDTVHFYIFGQFDIQRICPVGYHTDIIIAQFRLISHATNDIRLCT